MLLGVRIVHGHHPICDGFQGHEFTVSSKTFCASCLGLFIGASAALVTATMRFVFGFTYHPAAAFIGIGCVVLGLTYAPLLRTDMPILRSIFNVGLVTGFALLLAVADEVGGLELDLLVIGICVFWMFTRIQLSNWEHDRICRGCGYGCEIKED